MKKVVIAFKQKTKGFPCNPRGKWILLHHLLKPISNQLQDSRNQEKNLFFYGIFETRFTQVY